MNWIYRLIDWRRHTRKVAPPLFCGAGNVNWWRRTDARTATAQLVRRGVDAYAIEAFGWAETSAESFGDVDGLVRDLENLIFWCRRRRLLLFVSVVNDNVHLTKHGNRTPVKLADHMPGVQRVLDVLRMRRYHGLYVQPTAETQTPAGSAIEGMAARTLPKEMLVANSNGGRPRAVPGWAAYAAYHAARPEDKVPSGMWDVTDHGTLLNILGGTQSQDYKDDVVLLDAQRARKAGQPYVLYMFQQRKMSDSDLRAVAKGYYGGK